MKPIRDIEPRDVDLEKSLALFVGNFESASRVLAPDLAATWLLGVAEIMWLIWLRDDEGGDPAFQPDLHALAESTAQEYQAARPMLIAEMIRTLDAGVRQIKKWKTKT